MNPEDNNSQNSGSELPTNETPVSSPAEASNPTQNTPAPEPAATTEPIPESKPEHKDFTPKVIPQQGGHKKYRWPLIIVLLIIIAAGAAVYWFAIREDKKATQGSSTSSQSTSETATSTPTTPDLVAYAFKEKTTPYSIYWRAATGGNRTEVKKLSVSDTVTFYDSFGANVAFSTTNSIYVSTDGGRNYTAVYVGEGGAQITSLKFSSEGKNLAFGLLPSLGKKNTVKAMDLSGKDLKDLFTSEMAGVFINAYSTGKQKIIYREGCYNCSVPPGDLLLRDLKTNGVTTILQVDPNKMGSPEVSNDLSKVIYITLAPIKVNILNVADKKTTQITGPSSYKSLLVGFKVDGTTPYYVVDNQLYVVKDGKPTLVFKASDLMLKVVYVSDTDVIVGTGKDTSDYSLSNFNIGTQKIVKIFQGDNNTLIFGVTTK